ncbi:MAG: NAD-dependent epimerase/dehydratase family protein [Verrucomicrobiota bacterium]
MKLLVTGGAGFAGFTIIKSLRAASDAAGLEIIALDNLSRKGSELNVPQLETLDVTFTKGDVRNPADFDALPPVDWVIDAAANPSVLAGVDGQSSSRDVLENNLVGTINMLEYCRRTKAGFILLSTSRVYSIPPLANLTVSPVDHAFTPDLSNNPPIGLTEKGINEAFSTAPPLSLYGASKAASETLALEYGHAFDFEVWINRCGVLAGPGQFARPDQGIFAFWIHSFREQAPLKYIGFDGQGHQVRDCLHPRDLGPLLQQQMTTPGSPEIDRIQNLAGGIDNAMSLAQLSAWCADRFQPLDIPSDPNPRPFDLPWVVLDSTRAAKQWNWQPQTPITATLEEIAAHANTNPGWLISTR